MRNPAIIGVLGMGALAACGAPDAGSSPQGFAPAAPASAPESPIRYEGETFHAGVTVSRGPDGLAATAAGAVPVRGRMVTVTRAGAAMRYDEGKLAKDVARLACEGARGRYQPAAQGRFVGGQWQFAGACA
jgi:hypothetical protein